MGETIFDTATDHLLVAKLTASSAAKRDEVREQRISFVYGNVDKKNTVTKDQVRKLIEENE